MSPSTPLSDELLAAVRASPTCLGWKRAADLPPSLRVLQGTCKTAGDAPVTLSYAAAFPAKDAAPRGVVLFLHGVNEHCERYFHVYESLCAMGFGVVAYDLRSHGKSHHDAPALTAHVDRFQELVDDTNDFLTFAKQDILPRMDASAELPVVIMGMSLGTLVSLHTVLSQRHRIAGIVLVAPAVSAEMTLVLQALALVSGVLSALLPTARLVPGVNDAWVCRDPLVNAEYDADPLTTREPITCRMGAETLGFMTALQNDTSVEDASSAFCQIPILLLMGSQDKVTSLPLAQQFYARIASQDKQFELIDGAFHVLFEDFERERVIETITQWLHLRFPAQAK